MEGSDRCWVPPPLNSLIYPISFLAGFLSTGHCAVCLGVSLLPQSRPALGGTDIEISKLATACKGTLRGLLPNPRGGAQARLC